MTIRFDIRPSFEPPTSIALNSSDNGKWKLEVTRGYGPPSSRLLEAAEARRLDELVQGIRLQAPGAGLIGVDGTTYELEISNRHWTLLRLNWWQELPAGWESILPLVDQLTALGGSA